ncbi:MAG: hypothetical protein JXA13_13185 [Anaerolineales bacterium]|nr:hypothetical protein [Anaerolineales bacterium]
MITHRERMQACLQGKILDHPPVALWRHFPVDDQSPEKLAKATINFQRTHDFDLVKVTPASSYCLKDWGAEDQWKGATEGTRDYTKRVITKPGDWETLKILDPSSTHLAAQLECLRLIRKELGPEISILQTIFSPLSQAKNLIGGAQLIVHLRKYPEALKAGLARITESTRRFIQAANETGIDGLFYAVQHAQAGLLSTSEFEYFGKGDDLSLLNEADNLWLNMLHIHGIEIYFDDLVNYPVQIINWHDRDTYPSLVEAQQKFNGVVCGGLKRETVTYASAADVRQEAIEALEQTGRKRFILGTGCVVPIIASFGNIMAARQAVES